MRSMWGFTMKTWTLSGRCRIFVANIVAILAFGIFSCTVLAQIEGIHRYQQQTQDLHETSWLSRQRWELALAWIFSPAKFKEQWPRYGYTYDRFFSSCKSENLQRYDIGSGALATSITDSEPAEYIGLPLAGNTDPGEVGSFIEAIANGTGSHSTSQALSAEGTREGDSEHKVVRIREICRILRDSDLDSTDNLVVITQHPIPGPSTDLRLTELNMTSR